MSDTEEAIESQADAATQRRAEAAGWIPPSRAAALNGKPFVDADEFLSRREEVLSITKKDNAALRGQIEVLTANQRTLAATLEKANTAIEAMELEASAKTAKAVETAKREVKAELAKALADGDHEAVAALTQQQADLAAIDTSVPEKKVETKAEERQAQPDLSKDPVFVKWAEETPWWNKDKRMTRAALLVTGELREEGNRDMGRVFLDKVAEIVERDYGPKEEKDFERKESKVDSGRNSDTQRTRSRSGYESLPADARTQCDKDGGGKWGEGKTWKTQADYRAEWARVYNAD